MTKRMKSAMSSMIHSGSAANARGTSAGSGSRRLRVKWFENSGIGRLRLG